MQLSFVVSRWNHMQSSNANGIPHSIYLLEISNLHVRWVFFCSSMNSLNFTKFNLKLCAFFLILSLYWMCVCGLSTCFLSWPWQKVHMVIAEFSFKLKKFGKSRNPMEIYCWYGNHKMPNDSYWNAAYFSRLKHLRRLLRSFVSLSNPYNFFNVFFGNIFCCFCLSFIFLSSLYVCVCDKANE